MLSGVFTDIPQPFTIAAIYLYNGATLNAFMGNNAIPRVKFYVLNSSNLALEVNGTPCSMTPIPTISVYHTAFGTANGASSSIFGDGTQGAGTNTATSNFGTQITLFATVAGNNMAGDLVELLVYGASPPSAAQLTSAFASAYGAFPQ
jgi:hypothetical protein